MGTTKKTNRGKRRGPDYADTSNPVLKIERAATLTATREESTPEAAELQRKMKEAAVKFVKLYQDLGETKLIRAPGQTLFEACEELEARVLGGRIYCTPEPAVMFRLGGQWIKLTDEYVTKASEAIAEAEEVPAEWYAGRALKFAKNWAKETGNIGWVFPKLGREVVA